MKTDLLPQSYAPRTPVTGPNGKPLPAAAKLPGKSPAAPQDYKVDLSPEAKAPANPSLPSAPPAPSLTSAPSVSTPDLPKIETAAKEVAKDEAKEKAAEKAKEVAKTEEKVKKGSVQKPAVVFVSGLQWMYSPSKSEGSYAGLGRIAESIDGARLYGWDQADDIIEHISQTHPDQPVVLVGHSLGGDTVVDVANRLDSLEHNFRKVNLLVSMDAVGFNNDIIPQNVKQHLNIFGENSWLLNDGPHVARNHERTEVKNILSPLDHTELDDAKDLQFEVVTAIQESLHRSKV
jgi:hypothetical protein